MTSELILWPQPDGTSRTIEPDVQVITVTHLGEWCEDCNTSAMVEIDVFDPADADRPDAEPIITLEGCMRCGTGVCCDSAR